MIALSIRQPWASLIVNGYKDIENRTWSTRYRGPVLIHAGKGMTHAEYDDASDFAWSRRGLQLSPLATLERGGIVGRARIVDCVTESGSDWFVGPFGFVLAGAEPLPFMPCKGQLGFFDVPYCAQAKDAEARG